MKSFGSRRGTGLNWLNTPLVKYFMLFSRADIVLLKNCKNFFLNFGNIRLGSCIFCSKFFQSEKEKNFIKVPRAGRYMRWKHLAIALVGVLVVVSCFRETHIPVVYRWDPKMSLGFSIFGCRRLVFRDAKDGVV